jgi:hypothetical protein
MSVLDAALRYAARGLRVIPIAPGEKYPRGINDWEQLATNDADTIRRWFTGQYKTWGIGIVTGPLRDKWLFVLDVDEHDPNASGSDTLHELTSQHGVLPDTYQVQTPTGGRHYYFKSDVEIRNDAGNRLGPGLDIRGTGGQVLAPPTIHPNGKPYVEDPEHHFASGATKAPDWLVHLLTYDPPIDHTANAKDLFLTESGNAPSDRYNADTDWPTLLQQDGWTYSHSDQTATHYWIRPGKTRGISASVNHNGNDALIVFSTNAPVPMGGYSRFGYFAQTRHGGDWKKASDEYRGTNTKLADPDPDNDWPTPTPLKDVTTLPPFPVGRLPEWMRNQVLQTAAITHSPIDLAAMCALACLSAILNRKIKIRVTTSYTESSNLYLVCAMPPGSGKSPVFNQMLKPFQDYAIELTERHNDTRGETEQQHRMLSHEMAIAEKAGDQIKAREIRESLELNPLRPAPTLIADDATPEAVAQLLAEQHRIALLSSEGGLFDMMSGKYSDVTDLAIYNKGYTSDAYIVNRIGRSQAAIRECHIVIGITTQPYVISAMADNTKLSGTGLASRFMYHIPPTNIGNRDFITEPNYDPDIETQYNYRMRELIDLHHSLGEPIIKHLSEDAYQTFKRHRQYREQLIAPGQPHDHLAEWNEKLNRAILRTAALLHVANHPDDPIIDADSLADALDISTYWTEHAKEAHFLWGANQTIHQAQRILDWLQRQGVTACTFRDIYSALRKTFDKAQDAVPAVNLLIERGWLKRTDITTKDPITTGQRGKDSPRLAVNPALFAVN